MPSSRRSQVTTGDPVSPLPHPHAGGLTVHSEAHVLTKLAWTVPTLVGSRLYERDRKNIAAFDLGP
jgi:hypothetical protein